MKRTVLIPALFQFLALFPALALLSQSPQGIPYQAVMRNADGSVMANSPVNLTFMIHDGTFNGTVVYQESHALTSNAQGLVSCVIGNGTASQGTFASINWGSGAKFLHVMMGTTDLGTQQMLSVPYALYAGTTAVVISATGDTLSIGNQQVIVPGISSANPQVTTSNSGLGSQLLPGNIIAQNEFIPIPGCQGESVISYYGIDYPIVEINGQCWFARNLQTSQFQNGDSIQNMNDSLTWMNSNFSGYCYQNGNSLSQSTYGNLYNWFSLIDERNICPTGWHVPNDAEWMYLENSAGISAADQQLLNQTRGCSVNAGGKLKLAGLWTTPYDGYTNELGFSALPAGFRNSSDAAFSGFGEVAAYFSLNSYENNYVVGRFFEPWFGGPGCLSRYGFNNKGGGSVRCVRDDIGMIKGCRNSNACNYNADANFENGSCIIVGNRCDDNDPLTYNDVINANCQCAGIAILSGCTNPQACNFNALANVEDGSCLIQGTSCDDGNSNTTNDVINGSCFCAGTQVNGSQLLPGNATCATQNISVTSCGGQTSLTYDGRTYDLVEIGGQCWFADNLATDQYRNGDLIPSGLDNTTWQNTTAGAYAIYNNDPANDATYGKLYNWFTTVDSRGLCPTGWHVPTDCEWMYLEGSLGMSVVDQQTGGYRGSNEGGALKATTNWLSPNTGATNSSGFTAFPGGYRLYNGPYNDISTNVEYWWSSTEYEYNSLHSWYRGLSNAYSVVDRNVYFKQFGYRVRCIRD